MKTLFLLIHEKFSHIFHWNRIFANGKEKKRWWNSIRINSKKVLSHISPFIFAGVFPSVIKASENSSIEVFTACTFSHFVGAHSVVLFLRASQQIKVESFVCVCRAIIVSSGTVIYVPSVCSTHLFVCQLQSELQNPAGYQLFGDLCRGSSNRSRNIHGRVTPVMTRVLRTTDSAFV